MLLLPFIIFCEEEDESVFSFYPIPRFWGLDLEFSYFGIKLISPMLTRFDIMLGSAYEAVNYYRNIDNSHYIPPSSGDLSEYYKWNINWAIGIRQGLLFNHHKNDNLLETYLLLRSIYDINLEDNSPNSLIFNSGLTEAEGIMQNTIVTGILVDNMIEDENLFCRQGYSCNLTFEYGPDFLFNNIKGRADFYRLTFDARIYFTLVKIPRASDKTYNDFNLYICDRFVTDILWGNYIPITARQSIGGSDVAVEKAFGGAMRGIADFRFDSYFKIINNFDIRMYFPAFSVYITKIVPLLVLFYDTGIYDNLDYDLDFENIAHTTGFGIGINEFGFDLIFYVGYFINENRLSLSFEFGIHY